MPKYLVRMQYGGAMERTIEANSPEEAEQEMLSGNIVPQLDDFNDCVWEKPEVVEEIT